MLNLLKTILTSPHPGAIWEARQSELVLVVNKKNKITAARGDSQAFAGLKTGALRGRSIYTLIDPLQQDELASAINFVRRTAQGRAHLPAQSDASDEATSVHARSTPTNLAPFKSLAVTLAGSKMRAQIQMQPAGPDVVRLQISAASVSNAEIPHRDGGQQKPDICASEDASEEKNDTSFASANRLSAAQLADLSHEMKTPLNAILGFTDAIREETFGPLGHDRYREYVNDIHCSGQHLLALINSVLDLSRGVDTQTNSKRILVSLPDLIDETVAMIRPQLETAGLRLRVEIDRDLPEFYLAPQAVRQILINLLTNAIKFTSDGEISVVATRSASGEDVTITISDTGIGMSAEQLDSIGARFTDAQADGVRGTTGHGLGLTLAQGLAAQCGGNLALSSAPGEGLTAMLQLPMVMAIDASPVSSEVSANFTAGKPKVLVTQMERINQFRNRMNSDRKSNAA